MGNLSAAVSVVTTIADKIPWGSTVSALMSVSMNPPTLMVSLDTHSNLLSRLRIGRAVGVNILAVNQDQIASRFAQKTTDKFENINWHLEDGLPSLPGKHAWVAITVTRLINAGDHMLVLGTVDSAHAHDNAPLTYWQQTFGTHRAL